jgi:hypothetical protein
MKLQAKRPLAAVLGVLLAAAAPARAGTVGFADIARPNLGAGRGVISDMRLRAAQQQGGQEVASGVGSAAQGGTAQGRAKSVQNASAPDGTTNTNADPLGLQDPATTTQQGGQVETVDLGDVTGTVCDCGEIPFETPHKGVPWWPLIGIPLICVTGICTPPTNPTPTPPPPPSSVPEPATLMLFGSGLLALGAGARRRRARQTTEVEARDAEVV